MSKRVIGSTEVLGSLQIKDKPVITSINGVEPDNNTGSVTLPLYSREQVQEVIDMLPISRIGTMDYLPLDVNGSFEGASNYSNVHFVQPICTENDGTVVMLRPGTNGSSTGFYYSYVLNPRDFNTQNINPLTQEKFISTSKEFRPTFFSPNDYIVEFYNTDAYDLLFFKANIGGMEWYIISKTNGTLDPNSHQSSFIDISTMPDFDPLFANICGDNVYLFGNDPTRSANNNGMYIKLQYISLNMIGGSSMVVTTPISNLHGRYLTNNAIQNNTDTFIVYPKWTAPLGSGDTIPPLFVTMGIVTRSEYQFYTKYNFFVKSSDDNTQMRVLLYPTYRLVTDYATSDVYSLGISFTINVNTFEIIYDNVDDIGNSVTCMATLNPDGTVTFDYNDRYYISSVNTNGDNPGKLSNAGAMAQTKDGFVTATRAHRTEPTFGLFFSKVNGTPFDSLNSTTRLLTQRNNLDVNPTFGSAVGENLMGAQFVTRNKILLACSGTYDDKTYGYDQKVFAEIGDAQNYTYKSIQSGTLQGYAPQINREPIDNTGYLYTGLITTVEGSNVSSVGTSFIEGTKNTAGNVLDPINYTFNGTVTMQDSVLQQLGQNAITLAGITGVTYSLSTFYYVQDNNGSPDIGITYAYDLPNQRCTVIYTYCTAVKTGTDITSVTITSIIRTVVNNNIISVYTNNMCNRMGGINILKFSDEYNYVSISDLSTMVQPFGSTFHYMVAKYNRNTKQFMSNRYDFTNYMSGFSQSQSPAILPDNTIGGIHGFGVYNYGISDNGTKLIFDYYGLNSTDLDAYIAGTATVKNRLVIAAQDVAEGFILYFTQDVPTLLGGIVYTIPAQSYDLRTVDPNPGNKTFYIYVQVDRTAGKSYYLCSTQKLVESLTSVYIGTVTTNATAIETVQTEKVTRFLTYRPSTVKRGSAIPCSTGVPSGGGTRWH